MLIKVLNSKDEKLKKNNLDNLKNANLLKHAMYQRII